MSEKQVEFNQYHVKALRTVLGASDHIAGEVEDQLPDEDKDTLLELEVAHTEVVGRLLEAYQCVEWDELPDGEEYRVDLDIVREVQDEITEESDK